MKGKARGKALDVEKMRSFFGFNCIYRQGGSDKKGTFMRERLFLERKKRMSCYK